MMLSHIRKVDPTIPIARKTMFNDLNPGPEKGILLSSTRNSSSRVVLQRALERSE